MYRIGDANQSLKQTEESDMEISIGASGVEKIS
jgi:hypothetical protein